MNYEKLDNILCRLKIIAKIEPGEKIIISDDTIDIIDFSTYNVGRMRKYYHGETRISITQKLKDFFRDVEDLVNSLISDNTPTHIKQEDVELILKRLLNDLVNSLLGIKNLILTYNEDKTTRSELETIHERIDIVIGRIKKKLEQIRY
jgi:hypothetical protein